MDFLDKFDQQFDLDETKQSVDTAANSSGDVPSGDYEVSVEVMEIKETKKEPVRPMVSIWFEIVGGTTADGRQVNPGRKIFHNQVISLDNPGMGIHMTNEMLRAMLTDEENDETNEQYLEVKFDGFKNWANVINEVFSRTKGRVYYLEHESGDDTESGFSINKIHDIIKKAEELPF